MHIRLFFFITAISCLSSHSFAQHNDVEFGYDNAANPSAFLLSPLGFSSTTGDGLILVKSNIEQLDPFNAGEFGADQPGFTTHNAQGLIVNSGNGILINVLDASVESAFGVGFVNFYNPATDALEPTGRISFLDNTSATPDLVLNGAAIESGVTPQFIEVADSGGNVHDHIQWDLLDDATALPGAYGILVQLQSDFTYNDGTIELSSDPFWIVFNHQMSSDDFENLALRQFGVGQAVPVLLGDVNQDGIVNFLDISPFIVALSSGRYQAEADCNEDGVVSFLDISAFIALLCN